MATIHPWRSFRFALRAGLTGLILLVGGPGRAETPLPAVGLDRGRLGAAYDLNFRASHYDYQSIRVEGSGVQISLVKPTNEGLRVHVPPRTEGAGVGLCTKFGIQGDFEVIASYQVRDAPRPTDGPGIGPEVALQSAARWDDGVRLGRRVAPSGAAAVAGAIERGSATPASASAGSIASSAGEGRFYLARSGATVFLYVAEGASPYRKVAEGEFGTANVMFVRLATLYEGASRGLDVVWQDLQIRAEALPRTPGTPSDSTLPSGTLVVAGWGLLIVVAALLGVAGYRRFRTR